MYRKYKNDYTDERTICLEWDTMSGLKHQFRARKYKKKRSKNKFRKSRKRRKKSRLGTSKRLHQGSKMYNQNTYQDKYYSCQQSSTNKESPKVKFPRNKKSYRGSGTRIENYIRRISMDAVSEIILNDSFSKSSKSKKDSQQKQ